MNFKYKILTTVILLMSLLAGCSTSAIAPVVQENPIEEEENTPRPGGEIILASIGEICLDPLMSSRDDGDCPSRLVFDGLVKIDGEGGIKPALASSWDISPDHRTYTFKLRDDVLWHDGRSFNAKDVVGTFDKIMEIRKQKPLAGEPRRFQEFDNVAGFNAPDDTTFVVSLHQPDVDFLYDMSVGILPISVDEANPEAPEDTTVPQFIGTGPFKVVEYSPDSAKLRRNEEYFAKTTFIEEIEIKSYPSGHSLKEAFKAFEVDLVDINPEDWGVFQSIPEVYLLQSPSRYFEFLALNHNNLFFSDAKVRQAMLLALDREKMLQETFGGQGIVVDTPILPFSWAFNSQIEHIPFNPARARELLEEAGWRDVDEDGILEKAIGGKEHKFEFQLMVNMSNTLRYHSACQIENYFKDIGIMVKLVNTPWDELERKVMNKNFDAALMGWKVAPNPDLRFMFSSTEIRNGYNFVSYSNPQLDEILKKAQHHVEERGELLNKAQEIISQELPYLFLYSPNDLWAINNRLRGVRPNPVNLYDNIHEWWVDETA